MNYLSARFSMSYVEDQARGLLFILIIVLEFYGAGIIFYSANRIIIFYLRHYQDQKQLRLNFARHLALGLDFLLAAEIIRSITVREREELNILIVILVLRAFMALLIGWEIRQEEKYRERNIIKDN